MINSKLCQTIPQFLCPQHQLALQYLNLDQTAKQQTMCKHCPHIGQVFHVEKFQSILNESEQEIQKTINSLSLKFNSYKSEILQYLKNIELEFENLLSNLNIIKYLENETKEITNIHSLNTIVLLFSSYIGQNNLINHDQNQYANCVQKITQLEHILQYMKKEQDNVPKNIKKQSTFSSYQEYEYQSSGLEISLLNVNQQGSVIVWVSKNSVRYPTINILTQLSIHEQYEYDSFSLNEEKVNFIEFHPKNKIFLLNNYIYEYLESIDKWEKRQLLSKEIVILGTCSCDGNLFGLVNSSNQITLKSYLQLDYEDITQTLNVNRQIFDIRFENQSNLHVLLQGTLMVYQYQYGFQLLFQIKVNEDIYNLQCNTLNEKQFYIHIAKQKICISDSTFAIIDNVSVFGAKIINVCFNEKKNKLFVSDNQGKIRIYEVKQNFVLNLIHDNFKLQNIKDIVLIRFCSDSNYFVVVDKKMMIHIMNILD